MTVPVQTPVSASIANGATTVFPFGFKIADEEDIAVTVDGVLQTSGYTVSGVGNPAGGNITFSVAPANGKKVVRFLSPVLKRETDYQQFGDWLAPVVNLDFDRVWLALQALQQNVVRSMKLPVDTAVDQEISEDATTRANRSIKFDADGNIVLTLYDPDQIQIAAAASALEAAASAASAEAAAAAADSDASAADASRIAAQAAQAAAETAEENAGTAETNAVAAATAQGMPFIFDTTTTMADPGAGKIRFNHAAPASATAVALDDTDAETRDLSAYIATWANSTDTHKGTLVITKSGGAAFAIYSITGLTDNAGWTELAATYVAGNGSFSNADRLYLNFLRTGDKGTDGADGAGSGDAMKADVQAQSYIRFTAGGTADALTGSLSPAIASYAAGLRVTTKPSGANTVTGPTLNLNGLGAKTIKKHDASGSKVALVAGDYNASGPFDFEYDGTDFLLLNPIDVNGVKKNATAALSAGYTATDYNAGTKSSGTFTPDPANGNFQYAVNGGAHTLAPPSASCTMIVQYTNNGSAGAITTSGFTKVDGSFTMTNGDDFICYITRCNSFTHLAIKALQ